MAISGSGVRAGGVAGSVHGEYQSPCLKQLTARLASGGRHVVLDLGPAVGDNVSYFTQLSCKLCIADLYESISAAGTQQPDNPRAFRELLENDLPPIEGRGADVVLAWDLLNYLTPAQLPVLAEVLSKVCHRETQLFAMIATHKEMAARPTVFRVVDSQHLSFEPDEQWRRASPKYTEPDIVKGLTDFKVDVSFLLRNGLQEYVLNYRPRGRVKRPFEPTGA